MLLGCWTTHLDATSRDASEICCYSRYVWCIPCGVQCHCWGGGEHGAVAAATVDENEVLPPPISQGQHFYCTE